MTAQEARELTIKNREDELSMVERMIQDRISLGSFILDFRPSKPVWDILKSRGYRVLTKPVDGKYKEFMCWGNELTDEID